MLKCYSNREGYMDKKKIFIGIIIIALAITTIALRIMYVNTDLWYDEACSWFTAKQSFPAGIMDNLLHTDLQHTPIYFFILHFWMKIFGNSEIAIKSLSLLFGIGTVPLVYTATRKLTDNNTALWTTAIATVSPILVYFSTEGRMYPMVVFLVMLSLNYLIDFEQKRNIKSLIKLVVANVLIPYTLVGGILYNISLALSYGIYLFIEHKEDFKIYIKGLYTEIALLIPYFALILYYAKMRSIFVISHEGTLQYSNVIDAIRNFFGLTLSANIYWPADSVYIITVMFTILVIVPCIYFLYGYIQGLKKSTGFEKVLYRAFLISFILSMITALFAIHVFTVRYILYLVPPILMLSTIYLSRNLNSKHFKLFIILFVLFGIAENVKYYILVKPLKTKAYKDVRIEADKLELGVDDIIIMPFGADAPYYFRQLRAPQVHNFDYHKEIRNPYNEKFYDRNQQKKMADKKARYHFVFDNILNTQASNQGFSQSYYEYFKRNVVEAVPKGRFVLIALYGDDVTSVVSPDELRSGLHNELDVKKDIVGIMLKKYLIDVRGYLDKDFNFIGAYTVNNYSYMLYQKK